MDEGSCLQQGGLLDIKSHHSLVDLENSLPAGEQKSILFVMWMDIICMSGILEQA